jgi:hypothetical protein
MEVSEKGELFFYQKPLENPTADEANGGEDVNRGGGGDSDEEGLDVKNLMNKFKNLATPTTAKRGEMSLEELEALRVEAKNLREQFEKTNQMEPMMELSEEKRRQLEEEFKQLKGLLSRGSGDYCTDIQSQN